MNPESVPAFVARSNPSIIKTGQPHFVSSIEKQPRHRVEGQLIFMDRSNYENTLLSRRIPIFTSSQLDEARFGPPFRCRKPFNVYLGPRPMVLPEISYGEVLPPAGTQYLLISYTLPMDVSCISCHKQTSDSIDPKIARVPQTVTTVEVPQKLPVPSIDTATVPSRHNTSSPENPRILARKHEKIHSGKRMDMLKQRMLEELKARTKKEEALSENEPCKALRRGKNWRPKVPPLIIRLNHQAGTAESQDIQSRTETKPKQLEFTCDFCGSVQSNKSLISEHLRKCKTRLQKREKMFERKASITANPIEVILRSLRNSI